MYPFNNTEKFLHSRVNKKIKGDNFQKSLLILLIRVCT